MKFLVLFLALVVGARATPFVFTVSGTVDWLVGPAPMGLGETFTAQFLVETDGADSAPGDPVLGRYYHATGANIHFSGGFSLVDQAFEYRVVDSGFSPVINTTLDALIFDLQQPGFSLNFAYRFTPDTWSGDSALNPIITPFSPDSVGGLRPAEMNYSNYQTWGYALGPITDTAVSAQPVPDASPTAALLSLPLAGLALLARFSRRRTRAAG